MLKGASIISLAWEKYLRGNALRHTEYFVMLHTRLYIARILGVVGECMTRDSVANDATKLNNRLASGNWLLSVEVLHLTPFHCWVIKQHFEAILKPRCTAFGSIAVSVLI
jgi:hypothetical protein